MSHGEGASLRDRAGRPSDQAAAGLGDTATIPSAALLELAERCERATRSGAALDAAIWCALNGVALSDKLVADFERGQAPRYTASLDAAMTLVPEGMVWFVEAYPGDHAEAGVRFPYYDADERRAATPALALCAAALALCAAALRARGEQVPA